MVNYYDIARKARIEIMRMLHAANGSWGSSSMSCIDVLTVLYNGIMRIDRIKRNSADRDMFFLSKGHASAALYVTLSSLGLIPAEDLKTYMSNGTKLAGHPVFRSYPGIECSSGSLGHGLGLACGSSLASKVRGDDANVFVLLGDGECNEGSIWEVSPFAAKHQLNNLTVIVDRNRLQSYGTDSQVLNYGDMGCKFCAFGFRVLEIDGHNYSEIETALKTAISGDVKNPTAIIANTVKGKGISYMENKLEWHYKSPNDEQFKLAMEELKDETGIY